MPTKTAPPQALASRVAIRGRGRAGKALARALKSAGIPVVWVPPRGGPRNAPPPFDVIFIAVPDDGITAESRRLVASGYRARCAMHLSGALPARSGLSPWKESGASVASFHPLGSFSGRPADSAAGRAIAVEGDGPAVAAAIRIARAIGGRPWRIDAASKALYHAAATAAAGGTATLVAEAARAAEGAGMPRREAIRAFALLAREAADNVAWRGFPAGLTGPLARGDAGTLRLHRRALAGQRGLAAAYDALARAAREAIAGIPAEEDARKKRARPRNRRARSLGV